jgi:hypothetical protein
MNDNNIIGQRAGGRRIKKISLLKTNAMPFRFIPSPIRLTAGAMP